MQGHTNLYDINIEKLFSGKFNHILTEEEKKEFINLVDSKGWKVYCKFLDTMSLYALDASLRDKENAEYNRGKARTYYELKMEFEHFRTKYNKELNGKQKS